MRIMMIRRAILAVAISVAVPFTAQAVQITGAIDFTGSVEMYDGLPGNISQDLSSVDGVANWINPTVNLTAGDFASVATGSPFPIAAPWSFNSASVVPFWQVGGFQFSLTSSVIVTQLSNFVNVQGVGVLLGNGYDPTPASWFFTIPGSNPSGNAFRFSSVTVAQPQVVDPQPVPEPAGVLLVGMALLAVARKRKVKISFAD